MSDPFDPPEGGPAARPAGDQDPREGAEGDPCPWESAPPEQAEPGDEGPFPWDEQARHAPGMAADVRGTSAPAHEPPPDDPDAPRQRHDAFTEARKSVYLRALVKTGCILDACRLTGVSPRTVYRHQENDPRFHDNCRLAIRICATPVELTAWQRAVEGVEQEFACGGQVHVRRRYSDGLLRLLLQGSNPKKYGARPGFTRKRLLKHERKQMEREIRAELEAKMGEKSYTFDESIELLDRAIRHMEVPEDDERLAAGWTRTEEGHMIPPGYAWVGLPEGSAAPGEPGSGEGDAAAGEPGSGEGTPRDSM